MLLEVGQGELSRNKEGIWEGSVPGGDSDKNLVLVGREVMIQKSKLLRTMGTSFFTVGHEF